MSQVDMPSSAAGLLGRGWQALARGGWEEAQAAFQAALQLEESAEALEGLGLAAWWLDDAAATADARERAYRLYRQRGDWRAAARLATWLAWDALAFRGEPAVASGWLQRGRRLLEGHQEVPEWGWLLLREAEIALLHGSDTTTSRRLAAEAATLGRRLGELDLEMVGWALEGLGLVSQGRVAEGMRRLDEASAAAVGGELDDLIAIGATCCYLIFACERVADYQRAAQWCERLKEFCRRWRIRPLFAVCRTHYAAVLVWQGHWAEAEGELLAATEELRATRPAMAVEGVVRLAELRRRQGRLQEAAQLFTQVEFHELAQLGLAALALDQGDAAGAADHAERYLRRVPTQERTQRVGGLAVLVAARAELDQLDAAATALAELQAAAAAVGTLPLQATAWAAEGLVACAAGDHEAARRRFEDAADAFARSGAVFEAAQARVGLARCLWLLGRQQAAQAEAAAAQAALERIGARRGAQQAQHALTPSPAGPSSHAAGLTRRELEVLRLVAQGHSNQQIAAQLVLSEHTVHRHVANILTKLRVPSRAAAAADAAHRGLL